MQLVQLLDNSILRSMLLTVALVLAPAPSAAVQLSATVPPVSGAGDPHLVNVRSEHFDVMQPGNHTFLMMPKGATAATAALQVRAEISARGDVCAGKLYITELSFSGSWLDGTEQLRFSTRGQAFDGPEVTGLGVGSRANLSVESFAVAVPAKMATVTRYEAFAENLALNQHVTLISVVLRFGPGVVVRVDWEHQKERVGFSNWLKMSSWGLGRASMDVGGLLGEDDHEKVMAPPRKCLADGKGAAGLIDTDARREQQRSAAVAHAHLEDEA